MLNDPAALIAEALKRKFAHHHHDISSDKENSLERSPFGSPETPKVCSLTETTIYWLVGRLDEAFTNGKRSNIHIILLIMYFSAFFKVGFDLSYDQHIQYDAPPTQQ